MNTLPLGKLLVSYRSGYWGTEQGGNDEDVRVIRNGDIDTHGNIRWDQLPIRSLSSSEMSKSEVGEGDILLTTSGDCGFVAIVDREPQSSTCATNFVRSLRCDRDLVVPKYLYYWMSRSAYRASLRPYIRGTTLKNLSVTSALNESIVPLPPLPEQERIVRILDQADELRAKRRAALVDLDTLTQSVFLDMFGDPRKNPKGWPVLKIGDVVRGFEAGKSILTNEGDALTARFRVIKVSAITSGIFVPDESKPVPPDYEPPMEHFVRTGDLLFSRANTEQLVGASVLVEVDPNGTLLSDKIWRFVWNDPVTVLPFYVWQVLQTPGIRSAIGSLATGTSGSMKNISQAKLLRLELPVPPMELQRVFEARIKESRRLAGECRRSLEELTSLFASLQHRAFRGEL